MKYCELSQALKDAMNGEIYDFYAQRVERGYLAVDSGSVYFGEHHFRSGTKRCLIVTVPTLHSSIRGNSHHFVWYYVKRDLTV